MDPFNEFNQRRAAAERARAEALARWKTSTPRHAESESHQAAFLSGFEAVTGPLPITSEEFMRQQAQRIQAEETEKRERIAARPVGTCPECEGEGRLDGALHSTECPTCNGTGRVA